MAPEEIEMPSVTFRSILIEEGQTATGGSTPKRQCLTDLNLDLIVEAIVASKEEYDLKPHFLTPLTTPQAVNYRHEVMRDLENGPIFAYVTDFAQNMRQVREQLAKANAFHYVHQKERLFLEAVRTYGQAIEGFCERLSSSRISSRGLRAFAEYLANYSLSQPLPLPASSCARADRRAGQYLLLRPY